MGLYLPLQFFEVTKLPVRTAEPRNDVLISKEKTFPSSGLISVPLQVGTSEVESWGKGTLFWSQCEHLRVLERPAEIPAIV